MARPTDEPTAAHSLPGWDALTLVVLVFALLMVSGLAEQAALPTRVQDVLRHPVLGNILPASGEAAMGDVGPRPGDPIGLILNALSLGLLIVYLLLDLAVPPHRQLPWKGLVLAAILTTAVILPTGKLILLRQGSGLASYAHDGGVIQTEATIQYLFAGKNPYREDYVDTPMAEWGFSRYRTALYHYPYLPWTFLFSAPFYATGQWFGLYDQRFVYLILLIIALALSPGLVTEPRAKLALVALLGLNPVMALDVMFGQNDVFVLCWLIFSIVAWHRWHRGLSSGRAARWALPLSALFFGLACVSKPTAWFFAPFYGLLLLADHEFNKGARVTFVRRGIPTMLRRALPAIVVFGIILIPYVIWDGAALYDDVWRWSNGQGETGYQIWGWGASNFVLGLGLVPDRFATWPFWLLELIVALPLLLWLIGRQLRANTLSNACWHYGIFLLVFLYMSRFLNENYLGYGLAFLALGLLSQYPVAGTNSQATNSQVNGHRPQ